MTSFRVLPPTEEFSSTSAFASSSATGSWATILQWLATLAHQAYTRLDSLPLEIGLTLVLVLLLRVLWSASKPDYRVSSR